MTVLQDQHHLAQAGSQSEIVLYAKNTASYEEFCFRTLLQEEYVTKLEKWIAKKRYHCKPVGGNPDLLHLSIKIFAFTLKKISRDDLDILKDEFKGLKEQNEVLARELALFNYQFLSQGEQINRRKLEYQLQMTVGDNFRAKIVDNIENLFDKFEAVGLHTEDGVARHYLLLREPLGQEYFQSGGKYFKPVEVLAVGRESGQPEIVTVGKQAVPMQLQENGLSMNYYAYEVDRPVKNQEGYEVLISRLQKQVI